MEIIKQLLKVVMGIGMILVVDKSNCDKIKSTLDPISQVYEIGKVVSGKKEVIIQ